jgi:flagellar biosynthesis GTPase FlhF
MSTQLKEPQTNGHHRELSGVRTYRGRKLEDLIPQIRTELGPDAIILRQREGLMGGVGGFFAQKCVEVDAQAAPRVDFYDEEEPVNGWDLTELEDASVEPEHAIEATPVDVPAAEAPTADVPVAEAPTAEVPVNLQMTAESFVASLEQAAEHVDVQDLIALVAPSQVGIEPPARAEPVAAEPVPEQPLVQEAFIPAPVAAEPVQLPSPQPLTPAAQAAAAPIAPAPVQPAPVMAEAPAPAPVVIEAPAPVAPAPVAPAALVHQTPVAPVPPAANPWIAKQPGGMDDAEAAAVAHELVSQGVSESWAQELIVAAAAHRSPLSHGSLRDAVRATLAATIPAPAPLPATGAAVAFVGAGGAGKTRCAAALAAAYARASTLASSVVSLGSEDWGGDVKELLKGKNVWVMGAAVGVEAAPAVHHGRDGGLVVIDTAAATPRDPGGVETLAGELQTLSLDAVYIAVPATFSVHAARKLIDGFEDLGADGIAVTHADEADQLGIAAEISHISGMPVAYIHEGLELDSALSAADPSSLAARLLP